MSEWRGLGVAVGFAAVVCGCGSTATTTTTPTEGSPSGSASADAAPGEGASFEGRWQCKWTGDSTSEDWVMEPGTFTRTYTGDAGKCSVTGSWGGTNQEIELAEKAWIPEEGCTPPPEGQVATKHRVVQLDAKKLVLSADVTVESDARLECTRQ